MNRIDEVLVFNSLQREQLSSIVEIQLEGLRKRLSERGIAITWSEAARQVIGEEGYDPQFGARPHSARPHSARAALDDIKVIWQDSA